MEFPFGGTRLRVRHDEKRSSRRTWDSRSYNSATGGHFTEPTYHGEPYNSYTLYECMYDVSTPEFRKKQFSGVIVNSPMQKFREETSIPLIDCAQNVTTLSGDVHITSWGTIESKLTPRRLFTPQRLIDSAVTSAFAKVTANSSDLLLWLGETREAMEMFHSIGSKLIELLRMTRKQRKKYAEGLLTVKQAQSLTLQIQYGLIPLNQQIKQFLDNIFALKAPGRETVRGYNSYSDLDSYTIEEDYGCWKREIVCTENLSSNIRAGVLYDILPSSVPFISHIDARSVITAAYALSRLSFVVDWFFNVGNTLAAWAPTANTRILSAWVTVEETHSMRCTNNVLPARPGVCYASDSLHGSNTAYRNTVVKTRYPVSLADRPILPSFDLNLDFSKIMSLILLFARVK